MDDKQIAAIALAFLDRTPLEGRESEQMVLVRQWLRKISQQLPGTPQTPAS